MRWWRHQWGHESRRRSDFSLLLEGKPVGIGDDYQLIVDIVGCQGGWRVDLLLHCNDWELRERGGADFPAAMVVR